MEETIEIFGVYRILDANLNRLKEGIRVVEDTARYLQNDSALASKLKILRHKAIFNDPIFFLQSRDSVEDVLKESISSEVERSRILAIVLANFKRAQESARVLEEYLKYPNLQSFGDNETFKEIRYALYQIEKDFILKHLSTN